MSLSRILVGDDLPAKSFKGYFVARFSHTFDSTGVSTRDSDRPGATSGEGEVLAGYVTFPSGIRAVEARIGVSFISIEQARR
jgi:putative alpha-1,2-mannosidase